MQLTLDELKVLVTIREIDNRGKNAYGICPSCGQDEFGISLEDNHRFGCFRKVKCGFTGNIFSLLRFLGKKIMDVKPGFEPRARLEDKLLISEEDKVIDLTVPDIAMPAGWIPSKHHPYLEQRGFTNEDYDIFEPGMTTIDPRFGKNWVIFKIRQGGKVKGYIGRSTKSKKQIELINENNKKQGIKWKELRYKNSESDFAKLLLGIEEVTDKTTTAILVEGLFDKQNVDKKLFLRTQDEAKCLCTFKCGVSDEQIFMMQEIGITSVILMYDPDVIEEIKKAAWKLDQYFQVHIAFNDEGMDPGDMSADDFDRVFAELKTPSQFSVNKVGVPLLRKK
jgi:hypothetical protein